MNLSRKKTYYPLASTFALLFAFSLFCVLLSGAPGAHKCLSAQQPASGERLADQSGCDRKVVAESKGLFEVIGCGWSILPNEKSAKTTAENDRKALAESIAGSACGETRPTSNPSYTKKGDRILLTCRLSYVLGPDRSVQVLFKETFPALQKGFMLKNGYLLPAELKFEGVVSQPPASSSTASPGTASPGGTSPAILPASSAKLGKQKVFLCMWAEVEVTDLEPLAFAPLTFPLPTITDRTGHSLIAAESQAILKDQEYGQINYLPPFSEQSVSLVQVRSKHKRQDFSLPAEAAGQADKKELVLPAFEELPEFTFSADRRLSWQQDLTARAGQTLKFELQETAISDHIYYRFIPVSKTNAESGKGLLQEEPKEVTSFHLRFKAQDEAGQAVSFPLVKLSIEQQGSPKTAGRGKKESLEKGRIESGKRILKNTKSPGSEEALRVEHFRVKGPAEGPVGPESRVYLEVSLNRPAANLELVVNGCRFAVSEQVGSLYRFYLQGRELINQEKLSGRCAVWELSLGDESGRRSRFPLKIENLVFDMEPGQIKVNPDFFPSAKQAYSFTVTYSDEHLTRDGVDFKINGVSILTAQDRMEMVGKKSWTKQITIKDEGRYSFFAELIDQAGNRTTWGEGVSLLIDQTKPQLFHATWMDQAIKAFRPGFMIQDHFYLLEQNPDRIDCELTSGPGGAFRPWPIDRPVLEEGEKTCRLTAVDQAGNHSTTLSFRFYIDKTPPVPLLLCGREGRPAPPSGSAIFLQAGDFVHLSWEELVGRTKRRRSAGISLPAATGVKLERLILRTETDVDLLAESSPVVVLGVAGPVAAAEHKSWVEATVSARKKVLAAAGGPAATRCLIFTEPGSYEVDLQGVDQAGNRSAPVTYKFSVLGKSSDKMSRKSSDGKGGGAARGGEMYRPSQAGRRKADRGAAPPGRGPVRYLKWLVPAGALFMLFAGVLFNPVRFKRNGRSGRSKRRE